MLLPYAISQISTKACIYKNRAHSFPGRIESRNQSVPLFLQEQAFHKFRKFSGSKRAEFLDQIGKEIEKNRTV